MARSHPQAGQIDDLARGVAEGAADATGLPSTQTAVGLRVEGHHHVTRRDLLDRLFGAVRQEDGSVGKETMDVVSRIGVGIILDDSLDGLITQSKRLKLLYPFAKIGG